MIEKVQPKIEVHGLLAEHNMPCAVCWSESAVLQINEGHFLPCWECQAKGWTLTKKRKKKRRA